MAYIVPSSDQARPWTFRCPRLHTGEPGKGLSSGTPPSGVTRRILPASEPASPVATYSIPSGPNAMRPPSWLLAAGMPSSTGSRGPRSRPPGSPVSGKRSTRLPSAVVA
ncbi:hypothetical protein Cpa01nite_23490 [Cellulomonas pakistanensis]|uniref:Uncharacterized protein n=1 Tax=Cellulomonas pakistanensis TaxID=992287 RepID=A0A919U397_9CELL|nr:hypothetical protein Cpa01nite_23490 [Cellulomonas pakistanensis]